MRLYPEQKQYAAAILRQLRDNGVALLQLPTGQGKTIVALKATAQLFSRSRQHRPLILVTRKRQNAEEFEAALRGEIVPNESNSPWTRDAGKCGGLKGLLRGKSPKLAEVSCWSARNLLSDDVPIGALVIVDEVHRFQAFLRRQAKRAHLDKGGHRLTRARQRQFLLLSATPINPARISSEISNEERSLQDQIRAEDALIRNSFLDLYKAMISLSVLSRAEKDVLLDRLAASSVQSLEDFSEDLQNVMDVLRPIPEPSTLRQLGPKGQNPFQARTKITSSRYGKSVLGLMELQKTILKEDNIFYCAERMALAGVMARTNNTVGFVTQPAIFRPKGIFHHQPSVPYTQHTVTSLRALDRKGRQIRRYLSSKIDALYGFLRDAVWRKRIRKTKWKVLVFCAHRGSVASLAAELERRFHRDRIFCRCPDASNPIYGPSGSRRIVWSTEGYAPKRSRRLLETELIKKFSPGEDQKRKRCNGQRSQCPHGFVLVASDRSSESIDLHRECNIMVHFDLDWSPLRMIQRYGRLWRIDSHPGLRARKRQAKPRPPAVFHLVQPGSVDEEILWRLEKRWHRLQLLNLGLDQVTCRQALGVRIYGEPTND